MFYSRLMLPLCSLLLASCSSWTPVATAPMNLPALPEAWQQGVSEPVEPLQPWISQFEDPQLAALIDEALARNPTLSEVAARLRAGEAAARISGAPQYPAVNLAADAGRVGQAGSSSNRFAATLSLSWELDLWQRLSAATQSAMLDRDALWLDLQDAQLSLAANVAKDWFAAITAQQQQQLSERLVSNLEQSLDVLEENYRIGLVSALDIHLARANLATERSRLIERRRQTGEQLRQLEVRLGRYPAQELQAASQLPALPVAPPTGLPAALLQRRTDIRAAEARRSAAEAQQQARHADRWPRLRLTGSLGGSSDELQQLLRSDSLIWTLLGGISQPLLDGGRLEAQEEQAAAQVEQRQAAYAGLLLNAFSEVENALAQERSLRERMRALQSSVEASELAQDLAAEQYRSGLVDIITVLEAQRRAFNARSSLIEVRGQQLANRINLHLALGGDFSADINDEPRQPVNKRTDHE